MTNKNYISILNKIKHKPTLLKFIFPFSDERPFIFPYIVNKDKLLKKQLKSNFSSLRKDNNLSEMNTIIYKFVSYRLLSETIIYDWYDFYRCWNMDDSEWGIGDIDLLFEYDKNNSLIDYYKEILFGNFYKIKKDKNIHIEELIIENYFPKEQKLKKFIKDYFSIRDILFIPYDDNCYSLINEIIDYAIEAKPHITKIIFHKNYEKNKRYKKYFIKKVKEHKEKLLYSFNSSIKIEFDQTLKTY